MNVLMVSPWYKPYVGGVVIALSNLVSNLIAEDTEVSILTHGENDSITELGEDGGARIFSFNFRSPQADRKKLKTVFAYIVYFIPSILRLLLFLEKNKIDIVNILYPSSYHYYFLWLKKIFGKKYIVSLQGSDIRVGFFEGKSNALLTRRLLLGADALTACSKDLLDFAKSALGSSPEISKVISNGVDSTWLDYNQLDEPSENEKYILTVASLLEVKGIDILIKAFRIFADKVQDCRLFIAGDGVLREKLIALRDELNLKNHIEFLGLVDRDKLKNLYLDSLFCVMPSRNEGFPLAALEAQGMGKALIASNVGGIPEIIHDGVNGVLVPSEDEKALAEKMIYLYKNPGILEEMGNKGREIVRNNFTWNIACHKYMSLYGEVLSAK